MDPLTILGIGTGIANAGTAVGQALTANSKKKRERQLEQQGKLNEQAAKTSYEWGEKAAEQSYLRTLDMYNRQYADNSPANRRKQLEEAGLSIGLMYGGGAATGGGSASGSTQAQGSTTGVQAGQAPNALEETQTILGIQRANAEIQNLQSITKKNEAETKNIGEKTTTEIQTRDALKAKIIAEGEGQWLENIQQRFLQETGYNAKNEGTTYGHKEGIYSNAWIHTNSYITQEISTAIAKTMADEGNAQAQQLLTEQKTIGYWQELINATAHADADKQKAAAIKLASEWNTGEFTNWKTWVDIATDGVEALTNIIKIPGIIPTKNKKKGYTGR